MNYPLRTLLAVVSVLTLVLLPTPVHAQEHTGHANVQQTRLTEPGNPIFAAVDEVIQQVEADTSVEWADVDLERLRRHLIDMHRVAVEVEVVDQHAIEGGLLMRLVPAREEADSALVRVLQAHPAQLEEETGWTMDVTPTQDGYELQVTTGNPADVEKIRGLGYIGLLTYGTHHQQHHWMMATGQ